MKKYEGRKMLFDSRFVELAKTLTGEEQNAAVNRIDAYVAENLEYCDKGNRQHLCNIFSSMALYQTLLQRPIAAEEAEDIVFQTMYAYMQTQRVRFQKLARKNWFWFLIKKIVPLGFKMGSGHGWEYTWHKKGEPKNVFRFECNKCIYQQIFHKYGFERFGPKFCHNDIIVYGELPRTDFIRTNTICRGGDRCDFKFVRYKKGEDFERTESV